MGPKRSKISATSSDWQAELASSRPAPIFLNLFGAMGEEVGALALQKAQNPFLGLGFRGFGLGALGI